MVQYKSRVKQVAKVGGSVRTGGRLRKPRKKKALSPRQAFNFNFWRKIIYNYILNITSGI